MYQFLHSTHQTSVAIVTPPWLVCGLHGIFKIRNDSETSASTPNQNDGMHIQPPASSCPTDRYAWSSSDAFCESGTRQVSTRNHRSSEVERLWPEDWTTGLGCLTKFELEQSRKGWKPAENTSSSALLCSDLQLAQASEALRVRPQMAKAHLYGDTTAFLLFQL